MAKKAGLGRGLDSIFIDNNTKEEQNGVITARISEIEPRQNQPREIFSHEALEQLAESIAVHGIIQPLTVRESANGNYEIIAGERRWRAARMAGLSEVPVVIVEADDRKASELALVENLQRENLNPIEEAKAYRTLLDEYDLTQEDVSKQIGKSRSAVANSLRLLELPEKVLGMVNDGALTAGHARALLGLQNHENIADVAVIVEKKALSVRETERLVKQMNAIKPVEEEQDTPITIDYMAELERLATAKIGRRVQIVQKGKTKSITVHFNDNTELEHLLKRICGDDFFGGV